jgi:hypothetical protein
MLLEHRARVQRPRYQMGDSDARHAKAHIAPIPRAETHRSGQDARYPRTDWSRTLDQPVA